MDSDVSLACIQQRGEQLLGRAVNQADGTEGPAEGGEKGKKKYGAGWGGKRTKIKRTSASSKGTAEVKRSPNKQARKLRRDNTAGTAAGELEGGNQHSGRDSSQLANGGGIESHTKFQWPAPACSGNGVGGGHFLNAITPAGSGYMWMCKLCGMVKWMPSSSTDCLAFGVDMRQKGSSVAYNEWLNHNEDAMIILDKVEELKVVRSLISDEGWMELVKSVILEG
jgi:hypothetical protein